MLNHVSKRGHRTFQNNSVRTVAVEVKISSTAMISTMQDKPVLVFHKEGFRLPTPFQCSEMIDSAKISNAPSTQNGKG